MRPTASEARSQSTYHLFFFTVPVRTGSTRSVRTGSFRSVSQEQNQPPKAISRRESNEKLRLKPPNALELPPRWTGTVLLNRWRNTPNLIQPTFELAYVDGSIRGGEVAESVLGIVDKPASVHIPTVVPSLPSDDGLLPQGNVVRVPSEDAGLPLMDVSRVIHVASLPHARVRVGWLTPREMGRLWEDDPRWPREDPLADLHPVHRSSLILFPVPPGEDPPAMRLSAEPLPLVPLPIEPGKDSPPHRLAVLVGALMPRTVGCEEKMRRMGVGGEEGR